MTFSGIAHARTAFVSFVKARDIARPVMEEVSRGVSSVSETGVPLVSGKTVMQVLRRHRPMRALLGESDSGLNEPDDHYS